MQWELDEEHVAFQTTCRAFVDRHVRPAAAEAERVGHAPAELWKEFGAAGLLGLLTPDEYGGSGGDELAVALLAEEVARASGGIAVTALVSAYMAASHIVANGTEQQRATYLPALVSGDSLAAIAVTEPGTGSDVASIKTTATRTDQGFRLDGTKMFITNAGIADVLVVAAKTAPDQGRRGVTTFLVDASAPGVSFGAPLPKMGWHASDTREVVLDNVQLPGSAVLGQLDQGFYQIMHAFQLERVALAAMGLGHAAECLELVTKHARNREVFGGRLLDMQTVQHRIAAMKVEVESAKLMTYRAAALLSAKATKARRTVAMAKYHAAIAANHVVDEAVQVMGGAGFVEEDPVARHYRDVRILRIGGGADEVQLDILSRDFA